MGLGDVTVLGAVDEPGGPVRVHIETRGPRPPCQGCGGPVWVQDRRRVELVDLAAFGRPARLVWHKRRWTCPNDGCEVGSFTESAPYIAAARLAMTDRAGRWVTEQVGRRGRPVSDLAKELGCDWHTINDTVIANGETLVEDPDRIGDVDALGLDETLFARIGRWRTQAWSTSIVDVGAGQPLYVIPGRSAAGAWCGSPPGTRHGSTGSPGRPWIFRARGAWRSTPCSPEPPRSPIRSTW